MALIVDRAVLTQEEADQLKVEQVVGIHESFDWYRNPNLLRLPAHPINCDVFCRNGSLICVGQPGVRHLFITSMRTTPEALLRLIRQRWSIEN